MWLQLETGTKCNASCTFCPHSLGLTKRPDMPDQMIEKILVETIPHVHWCFPFLYQEPLLEPRLVSILKRIKQINPNCGTSIYTNFALMDKAKAKEILDSRALNSIFVSFYGPTKDLYAKYQPPLDWEGTKQNITRFMAMRKGDLPRVEMYYIEFPELMEHWAEFRADWEYIADVVAAVAYEDYGGLMPSLVTYNNPVRKPCSRIWNGINILSNGNVVPCCIDYGGSVVLGNAFDENVMDIWNGDKFNELRKLHREERWDELPELCKKCSVWKRE